MPTALRLTRPRLSTLKDHGADARQQRDGLASASTWSAPRSAQSHGRTTRQGNARQLVRLRAKAMMTICHRASNRARRFCRASNASASRTLKSLAAWRMCPTRPCRFRPLAARREASHHAMSRPDGARVLSATTSSTAETLLVTARRP